MADKVVHLTLTVPEAIKLVACCDAAYLHEEKQLANVPPSYQHRERLRNSMTIIQNLKGKIKEAIINRTDVSK